MKKRVDFRLVLLLIIAVIFLYSAVQKNAVTTNSVYSIEGDFIEFNTAEVFDLPVIESDCLEESSPLSRSQVL